MPPKNNRFVTTSIFFSFPSLTLILLMWRIWWVPNNASKWQMGFNSAFKGLTQCPKNTGRVFAPSPLQPPDVTPMGPRFPTWQFTSLTCVLHVPFIILVLDKENKSSRSFLHSTTSKQSHFSVLTRSELRSASSLIQILSKLETLHFFINVIWKFTVSATNFCLLLTTFPKCSLWNWSPKGYTEVGRFNN